MVPKPIPLNVPNSASDNIIPITTLLVSNIVFILPNSMFVTCVTANDTPYPGSTTALEFTSRNTPTAITKQLIIHIIHLSNSVVGVKKVNMPNA